MPSSDFLAALAGEADPEKKRKIIGRMFVEVFDEEAAKLKDVKWLAQGTIYPDVIESAGSEDRQGARHQVAPQCRAACRSDMKLKLLEPLRELFKDEVRKLGVELGLPKDMVHRHPFPGPGLGRAHPGRDPQIARRSAAARRRHFHRGAAHAMSFTTRSARRSRCSCRCARSA